jgi:hypothetical protein
MDDVAQLAALYAAVLDEPIPVEWLELIERIK